MNKILTFSFLLLTSYFALHGSAKAEYLYFMTSGYTAEGPVANFDYVQIGVAKNGDLNWGAGGSQVYLTIAPTLGSFAEGSEFLASEMQGYYTVAGPAWADVTDYKSSEYTFYAETYKSGATSPIWTYDERTTLGYAALLERDHIYAENTSLQTITPWQAVPEPTSGVLLLLGFAALSLRRKKVEGLRS